MGQHLTKLGPTYGLRVSRRRGLRNQWLGTQCNTLLFFIFVLSKKKKIRFNCYWEIPVSNSDVYEELTQHIGQPVRQGAEAGAVIILVLLYRERNKMTCPLPPPKNIFTI